MTLLTKGLYSHSQHKSPSDLFGLVEGQMRRHHKMTHNSGWYNRAGEKLGWGDLSSDDMARIASEIPVDEFFIALSESKSYWDHRTNNIPEDSPGVAYIAEHAMYVITSLQMYRVSDYSFEKKVEQRDGHNFHLLTRRGCTRLLKTGRHP